jgi:hypothetical protein
LFAARKEGEEETRKETEGKARKEVEERTRREVEERARREAEERVRREAEERARREAEERARREAEERTRREADERARKEDQERARKEHAAMMKSMQEQMHLAAERTKAVGGPPATGLQLPLHAAGRKAVLPLPAAGQKAIRGPPTALGPPSSPLSVANEAKSPKDTTRDVVLTSGLVLRQWKKRPLALAGLRWSLGGGDVAATTR